jgi:signal transduction histidine kinase
MTRRPFGLLGLTVLILAVAALVAGGLGWVTVSALSVEENQRLAAAQADRSDKERLALWRLDGRIFPTLGLEGYRNYEHFTALYSPPNEPPGSPLHLSPLISSELPEWMLLHFQMDPTTGWSSPQVLPEVVVNRLAHPSNDLDLRNLTEERRTLLADLNRRLPTDRTIAALKDIDLESPDGSAIVIANAAENLFNRNATENGTQLKDQRGAGTDKLPAHELNAEPNKDILKNSTPTIGRNPQPGVPEPFSQAPSRGQPQGFAGRGGSNPAYAGNTFPPGQMGGQRGGNYEDLDQANRQNFNSKIVQEAKGGLGNTTQVVPLPVEFVGPPLPDHLRLEREGAGQLALGALSSPPSAMRAMSAAPAGSGPSGPGGTGGGTVPPGSPAPAPGGPGGGQGGFAGSVASGIPTPTPPPAPTGAPAGGIGGGRSRSGSGGFGGPPPAPAPKAMAPPAKPNAAVSQKEAEQGLAKDKQSDDAKKKIADDRAKGEAEGVPSKAEMQLQKPPERSSEKQQAPNDNYAIKKPAPPAPPLAVHLGSMRTKWLTDSDGKELLVVVRPARLENKTVYQGVLLDWDHLRTLLREEVADDFPEADLVPSREATEAPQHQMTALPARFDAGPLPALKPLGWTPLRIGLCLAWLAALAALVAVWLGGWSLIDLSERRIRFVSAVTHELRTPLTSLRLYLDMLTTGMVKDEEQKQQYLTTLSHESNRLNQLIENVLDFAKLEKRAGTAVIAPTPVSEIIETIRESWTERLAADGKELVIVSTATPGQLIKTDPRVAQQILCNLIDNARKYSPGAADPRIWLWVKPSGRMIAFEVEDRGPGIPLAERRSIFRPFHRGGTSGATGGAGLGLALAKQWAETLGGKLVYRPADGGTGACFRLELPA